MCRPSWHLSVAFELIHFCILQQIPSCITAILLLSEPKCLIGLLSCLCGFGLFESREMISIGDKFKFLSIHNPIHCGEEFFRSSLPRVLSLRRPNLFFMYSLCTGGDTSYLLFVFLDNVIKHQTRLWLVLVINMVCLSCFVLVSSNVL